MVLNWFHTKTELLWNIYYDILTSGFGTDFTMQTIWAVPPGIALTDSDSTVITGLTKRYKWKNSACHSKIVKTPDVKSAIF